MTSFCRVLVLLLLPASCILASAQRGPVFRYTVAEQVLQNRNPGNAAHKPGSLGTQVTVSGNFGGTFTVTGPGSGTSTRQDEYINITTNQPLAFQASNFTTLMKGGSSASSAGAITYEMQLYAGTSSSIGSSLTGAVNGTDAAFDGMQLILTNANIPGNNEVVLRLSRTLSLTQLAEGGTTYTASGTIVLSIN